MLRLDWMTHAACKTADDRLFFAPDGEQAPERIIREEKAKRVCRRCPVMRDCAEYAVETWQRAGVWGGLTADEIANERRRRMRQERAA